MHALLAWIANSPICRVATTPLTRSAFTLCEECKLSTMKIKEQEPVEAPKTTLAAARAVS